MKRLLFILKDLQNSGKPAAIIGHFSIQTGKFQDVTNIKNVHEQTKASLSETDSGKNANRYTTEHGWDDVDVSVSTSVELHSDLIEVIDSWQNLPDSIGASIVTMVKAIVAQ